MAQSRQLSAIMFTDIVGYTSLMGTDEEHAFELLLENRTLQKKIIAEFNGTWIKELGDGTMSIFTTVSDAVNAAIKIQDACSRSNKFQLRIGLHQGEVVLDEGDVFGDAVNIASRLQAIAVPGSIYISARVYDDIKNRKEYKTVALGMFALKNVSLPVEVFAISNPGLKIPKKTEGNGMAGNIRKNCIMVLPFINMSNDPEQEYFSDGLTEELITKLSKLKDIKVLSRTTSMKYKGTKKDIKTIGREADAGFIMEGSVRKASNDLRITAQFVDARRDMHLWAETYRGTMDDIFNIQEQVSEKIVEAFKVQLTAEERSVIQKRYTQNTEAYQLYLQGRYFWKKRNEQGLRSAESHFEMALAKDPNYALAWAGLADTYSLMGEYTNIPRKEYYPKTIAAVKKALEIDNNLAEVHISLAISYMFNGWDWQNAEKEFQVGITLDPDYATGRHWYAEYLFYVGKKDEAFKEISLAIELDPISPGILKDKGILYYYDRNYDKAIETGMQTLELDPQFVTVHRLLSLAYTGKGMYEEAIAENELWAPGLPNKFKKMLALAYIYAVAGKAGDAELILADLHKEQEFGSNDQRSIALVYAALGDKDKAFFYLDKSYEMHEESLCTLGVDPKWDPIQTDPRFTAMLKKLGLKK